jgi:PAS domain S-box-containing protein
LNRKGRNLTNRRKSKGFRKRKQLRQPTQDYEKYRSVVENATDFIYVIDKKNRILSVNKSGAALFGRTPKEIEGKAIFDIFPKEVATQFSKHLSEVFKTGKSEVNHESRMVVEGKEFWTSVSLAPVMDKEGEVQAVLGVTRDITELKRTREQYKTIVQTAMDGFWRTNSSGRFLDTNDAYCSMIGYSRAELLKMGIQDVEASESPEETTQHIKTIMKTGSDRFETRHRRKDGKLIDIEVSTNYLPFDGGQLVVFLRDITERKRAGETLRENERKYRTLVENVPHGIYQSTRDGRILTANPALVHMLGYDSEAELLAAEMARNLYVNPDDRKAWTRRLEEGGQLQNAELVLKRKNGQELIALDNSHTVRDEQGRILYYEGTLTDITERKKAEDALRRRAEELAALRETVLDITGRHDLPELLNSIVERAVRLLGATSGGMYLCDSEKQEVRCVISYNTATNVEGTVIKYGEGAAGIVAMTGRPLIIDDYRTWPGRAAVYEKDQPFSGVLSAPMIWEGQVMGVIHVLDNKEDRHFTQADLELLALFADHAAIALENARYSEKLERMVAERTAKLADSQHQLQLIADSLPVVISYIDPQQRYRFNNKAYEEWFGQSPNEIIGRRVREVLGENGYERIHERMDAALSGERQSFEYELALRSGTRHISATYIPDFGEQGIVKGVFVLGIDITERKRMEEALLRSERLAAIGETTAMVGHDLRNPLQSISGAAYNIRRHLRNGDPLTKEMLAVIDNGVNYANGIINDLFDYSREVQLQLQPTTPRSIVKEALANVEVPENIRLEETVSDNHTVLVDMAKMRRVITNLIENAVDAMPNGGLLSISSERSEDLFSISVADTGVGIPSDHLTKIWRTLYTTKAKGIGLGLPIAKRIIEAHGGLISAKSTVGQGSTFTLTIPIKALMEVKQIA